MSNADKVLVVNGAGDAIIYSADLKITSAAVEINNFLEHHVDAGDGRGLNIVSSDNLESGSVGAAIYTISPDESVKTAVFTGKIGVLDVDAAVLTVQENVPIPTDQATFFAAKSGSNYIANITVSSNSGADINSIDMNQFGKLAISSTSSDITLNASSGYTQLLGSNGLSFDGSNTKYTNVDSGSLHTFSSENMLIDADGSITIRSNNANVVLGDYTSKAIIIDSTNPVRVKGETQLVDYGTGTHIESNPTYLLGIDGDGLLKEVNVAPTLSSGNWTPTISNLTNLSSVVISSSLYQQIGDIIFCSWFANVTATTADSVISFTLTLPPTLEPSEDWTAEQQGGSGGFNVPSSSSQCIAVIGNPNSKLVLVSSWSQIATTTTMIFNFTYNKNN